MPFYFSFIGSDSSSNWTLGSDVISELGESNSSVFVLIHFVDDLVEFLLSDEVSSRFDHSSKLNSRDGSISVEIEGVESLVGIESWLRGESLPEGLSGVLASNVSSPHALEFVSSVWKENIISSDNSWHIVRSSS